jgi:CubicO group peptidase (beta-lactamase class C family)
MKIKTSQILLISTFFILLTACQNNKRAAIIDTGIRASIPETIDAYLEANLFNNEPGISLLVRKDGEIVYKNSKGLANKLTGQLINSQTGFRLASISKPFVALAIMQLYEQKKIALEDSILTFLPELPLSWKPITIHHLLTHRSGIPDFLNDLHLAEQFKYINNQDVVNYFIDHSKLEFKPGYQADYSNSGYLLLAEIIERINGKNFEAYMLNNLFIPSGMKNSYILDESSISRPNEALNYADKKTLWGLNINTNGGYGQVTSIDDMNLFIQELLKGALVSIETLDLMKQVYSKLDQGNYGYGWFKGARYEDSFTVGGSMDGFESVLIIEPAIDMQYLGLSNGGQITLQHINNIYILISRFYIQQSQIKNI